MSQSVMFQCDGPNCHVIEPATGSSSLPLAPAGWYQLHLPWNERKVRDLQFHSLTCLIEYAEGQRKQQRTA